eukprot:UN24293
MLYHVLVIKSSTNFGTKRNTLRLRQAFGSISVANGTQEGMVFSSNIFLVKIFFRVFCNFERMSEKYICVQPIR